MAMTLSVELSRTLLSLGPLEINDHTAYYIAELGDLQITWRRQTTSSPFVDGEFTTQRTKQNVVRQFTVEVLGADWGECLANGRALMDALSQDEFTMTLEQNGETTSYLCEASDYVWRQAKERWHANRGQVAFSLMSKPAPVTGVL